MTPGARTGPVNMFHVEHIPALCALRAPSLLRASVEKNRNGRGVLPA